MADENSFFDRITCKEETEKRIKTIVAMLNKHTYGQGEKKMDNDPRWITGSLPNEEGFYLVTACVPHDEDRTVTILQYKKVIGWTENYGVLAWMPLPPVYIPPKAEEPVEKKCMNCTWFNNNLCMTNNVDGGRVMFVSSNNPDFTCGLWQQKM